jgi:hypothetical protein
VDQQLAVGLLDCRDFHSDLDSCSETPCSAYQSIHEIRIESFQGTPAPMHNRDLGFRAYRDVSEFEGDVAASDEHDAPR